MNKKKLQIEQLEAKMKVFSSCGKVAAPPTGWIKAVRLSLGMSLQQMANKLSVTRQSAGDIEKREMEGSITLKALKEAANALDTDVVYGLVPKDGSLDRLIERKAKRLAIEIVKRTSSSMELEDQVNTEKRLRKAVTERTASLKNEMPKILWD